MTFAKLAMSVYRHPDYAVETDFAFVQSTQLYVYKAIQRINARKRSGINLRHDREAQNTKILLSQILEKIETGETLPAGSLKKQHELNNRY